VTHESSRGATIMIVEDDAGLAEGLGRLLESNGMTAHVLTSGLSAVSTATRVRPDLIVLDVVMPGIDGWELLARMRESAVLATVPVMMLTARSAVDDRVRGLEMGADDYLTKPFAIREFLARVDVLLRRGNERASGGKLPVISKAGERRLVDVSEIEYAASGPDGTRLFSARAETRCPWSLREVVEHSGPTMMRVHRSYAANVAAVHGCRWVTSSRFVLIVGDAGREVPVGRQHIAEVRHRLGLS